MPECPQPPLFLLAPVAPSRPTTGSLRTPIPGSNKGPLPLGRSGDTDVPVSSVGPVASSRSLQPGYTSGQGLVTSGLTPAQCEEIFLLSREVQTLRRKLALDFIGLSHQEARFRMGALATSHEKGMREWPGGSPDKRGGDTQHARVKSPSCKPILFCFVTL